MKRLLVALAAFAVCAFAGAQTVTPPTSIETVTTFRSIKSPVISEVITQRIGILHDIAGFKGTYLDLRAIGGMDLTNHNVPAAGFTAAVYLQAAKEFTIGVGPVFLLAQGQRPMVGAYIGLHFSFGK